MTATIFDVHVRTVECRECGAPVAAPMVGGQVQCAYCGAVNVVQTRASARGAGAQRSVADEVARLSRLKAQLQNPIAGHPYDLERPPVGWTGAALKQPGAAERLVQEWQAVRARAASAPPALPEDQRRLCWLAMRVADAQRAAGRPLQARAALETALELLQDEGHRHLIRCRLASEAVDEGDLASAEGWLAECDPAPEIVELDSPYRAAAARLRTRQGDAAAVLALVGMQAGDVPVHASLERRLARLRVHALEATGHDAQADAEYMKAVALHGTDTFVGGLRAEGLAPKTLAHAALREKRVKLTGLRSQREELREGFLAAAAPTLGVLPVLAAVLLLAVSVVRCAADADPLIGSYGYVLCPRSCEGCRGPARVVTVWTGGGGEYSTNGAQYFCPSDANQLDKMSNEALEMSVYALRPYELGWVSAQAASYLMLLALLSPLVLVTGLRRLLAHRKRAAALDEERKALAAKLGVPFEPTTGVGPLGFFKALLFNAAVVAAVAALGALDLFVF